MVKRQILQNLRSEFFSRRWRQTLLQIHSLLPPVWAALSNSLLKPEETKVTYNREARKNYQDLKIMVNITNNGKSDC